MNLAWVPTLPAFEDLGGAAVGPGGHRAAGENERSRDGGDGEDDGDGEHGRSE
jgi:hypothetical protein